MAVLQTGRWLRCNSVYQADCWLLSKLLGIAVTLLDCTDQQEVSDKDGLPRACDIHTQRLQCILVVTKQVKPGGPRRNPEVKIDCVNSNRQKAEPSARLLLKTKHSKGQKQIFCSSGITPCLTQAARQAESLDTHTNKQENTSSNLPHSQGRHILANQYIQTLCNHKQVHSFSMINEKHTLAPHCIQNLHKDLKACTKHCLIILSHNTQIT